MTFSTAQKGGNQYLICSLAEIEAAVDEISVMMVNGNQKDKIGLAKISFDEENGARTQICYDITGMMPLTEFLNRNQTQTDFRNLILKLVSTLESFDDYMIDLNQVLLNPDYVYINFIEKKVVFICMPFSDFEIPCSLELYDFFHAVCTLSSSNVALRAGEISYLNLVLNAMYSKTAFSLQNLKSVLTNPVSSAQQPETQPQSTPNPMQPMAKPQEPEKPFVSGDVTFTAAQAAVSPVKAPVIPQAQEKKPSGSIVGKVMGLLKKTDETAPAAEKPVKAGKKEKPQKARKNEFVGGLASLASGAKAPQQPAPQPIPQMTTPQMTMPQTDAQPDMPNHTIYVPSGKAPALPDMPASTASPFASDDVTHTEGSDLLQSIFSGGSIPPTPISAPAASAQPFMGQDFGGTSVLSGGMAAGTSYADDNRTMLIQPELPPQPEDDGQRTILLPNFRLIRCKTGEEFVFQKPIVQIGRDMPDLDVNIMDNRHIGHQHATIMHDGSGFSIIDQQSANHTYMNGQLLTPKNPYRLENGAHLHFADEEFEFREG